MEETLRILVALGFSMLLVLLRADAVRFGVAETRDRVDEVTGPVARRRLGWYGLALAISAAIVLAHPDPGGQLGLSTGGLGQLLALGLLAGGIGVAQAALVAKLQRLPLVPPLDGNTPWTVVDGLATALIDEVAFRGAMLGFLIVAGALPLVAIAGETVAYALATRTASPGGDRYLLGLAIGTGLLGGALTLISGGIAAAFLGHAATRIAVGLLGVSGTADHGGSALARARS